MRKEDKAKYNYKRIEIYLSPKDAALFEKKAIHYKNWGPFVRESLSNHLRGRTYYHLCSIDSVDSKIAR